MSYSVQQVCARLTVVAAAYFALTAPGLAQGTTTPGMPSDFGWKDGILLAIAVLGAGLGIINTVVGLSARKLRVLVQPEHAVRLGQGAGEAAFNIAVINLSAFPVSVKEIGFLAGPKGQEKRFPIQQHAFALCQPPPCRLDPRDSISFYFHPFRSYTVGTELGSAYALLATGEVITGTSVALGELQNQLAERQGVDSWRRRLSILRRPFEVGRR